MKSLFPLLIALATTAFTLSTPLQPSINQPPYQNTTTSQLQNHAWPHIPFEALIIDSITLLFIHVSPLPSSPDPSYAFSIRSAITDLASSFSPIKSPIPFQKIRKEIEPVVFELRLTGRRSVTGKQLGLFLEHVGGMFKGYGPASLTARLIWREEVQVGSFSVWVPFPGEEELRL